jgi:hypothetical protein
MPMNAVVGRTILRLTLLLGLSPAWAREPDVIYYVCKMKPAGEYMIRVDKVADVMWVNGTRLKLVESEREFRATEFSGEPNELKAEYRLNRASGLLRRLSYNLNGTAVGAVEGVCKASDKPVLTSPY